MFFLLRTAFWLSIVLALLPSGGAPTASKEPSLSAIEAMSAAGAAVSDMRQFCERQPDACDVGAQAAVAFGQRAQAGARMVLEFIGDKIVPSETGSVAPARAAGSPSRPAQHTLTPADLQPAWRGPAPRKDADAKRPPKQERRRPPHTLLWPDR